MFYCTLYNITTDGREVLDSFGGDITSRRSLVSGVYARGRKNRTQGVNMWTQPLLEKDNSNTKDFYRGLAGQ